MILQLVYTLSRLLCLKERPQPICFLDHLLQFTRFPLCIGIHFQRFSGRCPPFEAVGRLFQISMELRFGFLYRGVYSVSVGLKDVAPEFAG